MNRGNATFVRLTAPPGTPEVDLEQIEREGLKLNNVTESLKDLNNGAPMYGYAIGVETGYNQGVLVYIPGVDPFHLKGTYRKEAK